MNERTSQRTNRLCVCALVETLLLVEYDEKERDRQARQAKFVGCDVIHAIQTNHTGTIKENRKKHN